ncbi:MAG: hypothetical protein GY821_04470 [Gammaproteobacteria bacterium]|nr:hypothetical protein [Gammaproteobacteria bacterium]
MSDIATTLAAINFAIVQPHWHYWGLLPGLLLLGTGSALSIPTAGTAAVSSVDSSSTGLAGGLSFMVHLVFGAMGVATGTVFFSLAANQHATSAEFANGVNLVFIFGAVVAFLGIINSLFLSKK